MIYNEVDLDKAAHKLVKRFDDDKVDVKTDCKIISHRVSPRGNYIGSEFRIEQDGYFFYADTYTSKLYAPNHLDNNRKLIKYEFDVANVWDALERMYFGVARVL